jgi:tetratricopeptide (TPR) repeat protein
MKTCLLLMALALGLVLSGGCTKASKAGRLLTAAERDYAGKKYDAAEIEYQKVLSLSPRNPDAIRHLGLIYSEEGRMAEAYKYLRTANEQDPKNPAVQLKLAEIYSSHRNTNEAVHLLLSVLQSQPANEEAMLLLAQASGSNDLSGLRQRLDQQSRQEGQGAAVCHAALGFIDLRMNNPIEAETEFQKASALNPKLASPYLGRAYLCGLQKDVKGVGQALMAAAELSPVRSAARLKYVEFRLQAGDVEEARRILREMTRQAPDYLPAWLHLMRMAFAEHKYDECKEDIDRILARDTSNFDAMMQLGAMALAQQDAAKALKAFQRVDDLYKNVKEVKYCLALALMLNNEKQKATDDLGAALSLDRDYAPAVLLLAQVEFRSGRLADAISLLSQLIKNHPENAKAQLSLAEAYLAQNQPDRALAAYQQLAQRFPKEPEVPLRIGAVYEAQNNFPLARAAFEKALTLAPDNLRPLEQMTGLDILEKRYDEAHLRVAAFMGKNPKAAEPLVLQGDIDLAETRTNLAEAAYSKAIELNANLSVAYLSLARLYVASHQDQQALQRLDTLAQKTNETAMIMIGQIHQTAGRNEQAREAYERVLAVQPKNFLALNNLAYIDSEFLGRLDRALQLAQEAQQLRPNDPYTADTLGWILYKKHEYAHALNLLQESEEKQPGSPEVQMHLGMAYYMMEEEAPARLYLQRALAAHADFPGKDLMRRRLSVLDINPTNATPAMVQDLQSLMREDPQDPVPLSRLASIQEQRGDSDAAMDSLQKLLAINHQVWPAMINLSRLYAEQKHDLRKALELAKSAHTLVPNEGRASAWLGELVYRSGGDYPWALSLLQQAANQSYQGASLNYYLGLACYAVGRLSEADASMQKVVSENESEPCLVQAREFLAMRAAVQDPAQTQASAPLAKQILARNPNDVPALMVTALLAERRGAVDEAGQTYEKVLSIQPLFAPAMRQMAILYSHSEHDRDLAKAYDFGEKARVNMPNDPELAKTLGLLAYRRADYKRSMVLLRETDDQSGKDGEVSFYLGMDYFKLKQPSQSKLALQRALDLRVPDILAAQARRTLIELK